MMKVPNCRDCKHFRGNRWLFNLWGLFKDEDYYKFATCNLGSIDGTKRYCSVQRIADWDKTVATCDRNGRSFEPKESTNGT